MSHNPDEMKGGLAELTTELGPNAEQEEIKHNHFLHRVSALGNEGKARD